MKQDVLFPVPDDRQGLMPLPSLAGVKVLALDTETTGLDVFGTSRPVGLSIASPEIGAAYFPWGHERGDNYDEEKVRRWCHQELKGKELVGANVKFDVHMLRKWGVDLEGIGCRVRDVQHAAALVDERRRTYSLEALAREFLGVGKVKLVDDGLKLHEKPSHVVAEYAAKDAWLTFQVAQKLAASVDAANLGRVLDLEDDLIYATCEMERNGAPIDVEKLESWTRSCNQRLSQTLMDLYRLVGFKVNPSSPWDLLKVFQKLRLPVTWTRAGADDVDDGATLPGIKVRKSGIPSFTWEILRRHYGLAPVRLAIEARQLQSLLSKYLEKYRRAVGSDGILRYSLNQLRSDEYGTVTGRYSSSNVNIQQVFNEERQEGATRDYYVRELFIPARGKSWVCADASQIEFRLFAHYSEDAKVIRQYVEDPNCDFHTVIAKLVGLDRTKAKSINFGRLYGMGLEKLADQMKNKLNRGEAPPTDEEIKRMYDQYDAMFPAVKRLSRKAMNLAEKRGFVRTYLGRRRRYGKGDKMHSALNAVIQGTAADVMKTKLLAIYRKREQLGLTMRFTVHDELDGDLHPGVDVDQLKRELDRQELDFQVPIIWTVKTGENWKLK
jgi:DNA polymerase-1